jgi:hypothetical protein
MGHIETAVGMFNAGEVLLEYFRQYDVGTADEKARRRSSIIPMMVVYIFGIEVGLKALIEKQGLKPPRIHDLRKLYGKLPASIRCKIEDRTRTFAVGSSTVENLLSYHRNSFEEWRYVGDFDGAKVVQPATIAATLRAIIEVHTELYGAEQSKPAVPSRGPVDVPLSIQATASEYVKDVFKTDMLEGEKTPGGP